MRPLLYLLALCCFIHCKSVGQQTNVYFLPRIGHDFIIGTGNDTFARGGRYIFEKTNQGQVPTPRNWYAGVGLETYNASSQVRFMFDALFIDRTINQKTAIATHTYHSRAFRGKALMKYVFGDFEVKNHFFLAGGAAYTTNLSEQFYENGILKTNVPKGLTSDGVTVIGGVGYEWTPGSSAISSADVTIAMGLYYNHDLFPFVKAHPDTKLSYLNIGFNLRGVVSLLVRNRDR